MEKYLEGYINNGRITTEPPYWVIQHPGEVHMNGKIILIPGFRKKLKELVDNPKPLTWYHAFFLNGRTYFSNDSTWYFVYWVDGKMYKIPGRRIGSILTAKQTWWQRLFGIVRLPTLMFMGEHYILTESSNNIGKFTRPKGIRVTVLGWFDKRKGD